MRVDIQDMKKPLWVSPCPVRIEMNITELCNLRCDFCPRAHGYPNVNEHMSDEMLDLFLESHDDFYIKNGYQVPILLIGRGEPTLHSDFVNFCTKIYEHLSRQDKKFPTLARRKELEGYGSKIQMMHTNGYKIDKWLPEVGHMFGQIDVNCYSEKTYQEYLQLKEEVSSYPNVVVHDRGTTGKNEILPETRTNRVNKTTAVTYNNRAGSIPQDIIPMKTLSDADGRSCYKPFDIMYLDLDGEWRICCNDWDDLVSLGNLKDISIHDHFYNNPLFNEYRWRLANGDRSLTPCNKCNASLRDEVEWKEKFGVVADRNPEWMQSVRHLKLNNKIF